MSDDFRQYVAATQAMLTELNGRLGKIQDAIQKMAEIEAQNIKLSAGAYDMSFLALRTISELHVDFRTMLLRLSQEPATNPAAQENRDLLVRALSEAQKLSGERPVLKPV